MPHVIAVPIADQGRLNFGIPDMPQVTIKSPNALFYLMGRINQMNTLSIETRFD
jgi:hypothetical protein